MAELHTTSTDIQKLYGIGRVRAATYAKMGIRTVADLLEHYPRGYENRGDVRLLCDAPDGAKCAVQLTVATEPRAARLKNRMTLLKFKAYDDSGFCEITYFNQEYLKDSFPVGTEIRFYGKVQRSKRGYAMTSPAFELCLPDVELAPLFPVYPLTEGLTQKQIAKDMRSALAVAAYSDERDDPLPEELRRKYSLAVISFARRQIHAPDSFAALAAAKKRLIFDELLTFALGVSMSANRTEETSAFACKDTYTAPIERLLPYSLTDAQRRVINDIKRDMSSGIGMNRMIVGDVGCGKTVCAAIAIYIAVKNGRQAALMAPTEILATQHYKDISELLSKLDIRCERLVGSMLPTAKKRVQSCLASGDVDVVIGTQALLSDGVAMARPGIVIADEQHRFGVDQRAALAQKCENAHMLVMSATPIPRSLALAAYGSLDVSRIDMLPPGRQRVDTFAVDESYRDRLNAFIVKQVESGGQVYVVCPTINDREDEDIDLLIGDVDGDGGIKEGTPLKSAKSYAEELQQAFPQLRMAVLHGRMKTKEKDDIMRCFAAGYLDVLVSTTVIEVGVNVPRANLMIVENADRFGLSQLHQLRGRVGRGSRKSYCVLVSDAINKEGKAKERLLAMKSCYDGFEIAEKDLEMRGPGDFLRGNGDDAVRQSGGVRFKLAQLCDDASVLACAFEEAKALLERSPDLSLYPALAREVEKMFTLEKGTIN